METHAHKLFIVDNDEPMAIALRNYLHSKFGTALKIFLFKNGEKCLQNIDEETDLIVMDPSINKPGGRNLLRSIKKISPHTEVILFSNNEDVTSAIESYKKGADVVVSKNTGGIKRMTGFINRVITQPIRRIFGEYSLTAFVFIFIAIFALVGIIAFIFIRFVHINYYHQ